MTMDVNDQKIKINKGSGKKFVLIGHILQKQFQSFLELIWL